MGIIALAKAAIAFISGKTSIVVAPADANWWTKIRADVVLDGTADQIKINAAIEQLCTNPLGVFGDWKCTTLEFLEGRININGPIMLIHSLFIRGQGCSTIFFLEDDSNCDMFTHEGYEDNDTLYKLRLKDFLIDGNVANNLSNDSTGIKLIPQEYLFEGLWVVNCYRGLTLYGENSYGGFMDTCFIQNNRHYGIAIGGDSIVVNCGIGGNGNDPSMEFVFGSGGVYLAGWNTQFSACHFAINFIDIFGNWAAYNQVQCCVFEAGLKENIRLEGRAWGWTIVGNRFGGRRSSQSTGSRPAINFQSINSTEKAFGNVIANNSFTVYESGDIGYNNCIRETANCDRNMITGNIFYNGHNVSSSDAVVVVGANTVVSNNID